jgi:hypothetical protein
MLTLSTSLPSNTSTLNSTEFNSNQLNSSNQLNTTQLNHAHIVELSPYHLHSLKLK